MSILLTCPKTGEAVALLPEGQKALRAGENNNISAKTIDWLDLNREGVERSYPLPVRFEWKHDCGQVLKCELHIGCDEDLGDERIVACEGCKADVYNLLIGQRYFWKVHITTKQGLIVSDVSSFTTEEIAPRLIRAEGMTNIRDIGGWTNADGRKIRQQLLYRGSEMDTHHTLTEDAKHVLRDQLRIRTDLDLRGEAVGREPVSTLGKDIRYILIPTSPYEHFMQEKEYETCRALFSVLADESNYPIYVHCWGGADRTGTLILMLDALLDMDDESLMQDYELTSFAIWGPRSRDSELFKSLLSALNRYGEDGEAISVKVKRFLLIAGVTQKQIEAIRNIFL